MIDVAMYAALGFLIASLLALMLAPPLWKRAVRLTTRRVEATMPMSVSDIQADKDQLRAEFAIELRRVEVARDKARDKAARELVEANKRRVEIAELKTAFDSVKGRLQEKENANRVLEQTIRRRLPELETSLKAAKQAMAELEAANAELRNAASSQAEALKLARTTVNSQRGDIDQLRGALGVEATSSRRSAKSDSELAKENRRLSAEFSKLKEELTQGKIGGKENDLLRRELGTLAKQILAVAKAQGMALPELAAAETSRSFVEEGARETPNERAPAFIARREDALMETPAQAPESSTEVTALAASPDATENDALADAEGRTEAQGSLARILAARKARRRGSRGKGGGQSLSERLKNASAEASDG
jgi:chromosome segregation ATPase